VKRIELLKKIKYIKKTCESVENIVIVGHGSDWIRKYIRVMIKDVKDLEDFEIRRLEEKR